MITHGTGIKIFTGNSNPVLAKEIAKYLGFVWGFSGGNIQ